MKTRKLLFLIISFWGFVGLGCQSNPKYDLQFAKELIKTESYEAALAPLGKLLQQNHLNSEALFLRAKCNGKLQNLEAQASDLRRLLAIDAYPCDSAIQVVDNLVNIFEVMHKEDSMEKYIRIFQKKQRQCAINSVPDWSLYRTLASISLRKRDFEKAHVLCDSAKITGDYTNSNARLKGTIYIAQGKSEMAIVAYSKAILAGEEAQEPFSWDYLDRGSLLLQSGKLDSACADWQKALNLGNTRAQAKLDSFCIK